jgi:hypothetical protein
MKEKRCTGRCKQVKPLNDFNNKKANRDGKNNHCMDCVKEARSKGANIQGAVVPIKLNGNCMDRWWV